MIKLKRIALRLITVITLLVTMSVPVFAEDGWTQCSKSPNEYYRIEGDLTYWKSGLIISSDVNAPGHWDQYMSGCWKFVFEDGYRHSSQWLKDGGNWYYVDQDGIMSANCTMWNWQGNCYVMDGSGKLVDTYYDASCVWNG